MVMGTPQALKQVNLSMVRRAIRDRGCATRSEIAALTKISVTTVRALLLEMGEAGEIAEAGQEVSSGGRKAVRYRLCKDKYCGAALCVGKNEVRWLVANICGEIGETGTLQADVSNTEAILALLDDLTKRYEIKSIGIGVPGIPDGLEYWQENASNRQMEKHSIGRMIQQRYDLPVVLENDLNAITFGFARCYLNRYPDEKCSGVHMAYLHFEANCLSAGFIVNGRLIRGWKSYSGELGLYPVGNEKKLDDTLAGPLTEAEYAALVAKIVAGICCVLNPQYVALGGEGFRRECFPLICECFSSTLPTEMAAELLRADDIWHDYFEGMAAITTEHIFSDVQLVSNG